MTSQHVWDTPRPKSQAIDDMLTQVTGKSRVACIQQHKCTTCDRPMRCRTCNEIEDHSNHTLYGLSHIFLPFRDRQSEVEYTISGICQSCQDSIFGTETDYEEV